MAKKVSASTIRTLNKLTRSNPIVVTCEGIEGVSIAVEVKDRLTLNETIAFTERIMSEVFSYNDAYYNFHEFLFIKILSIEYFTNITLPEDIDEKMDFVLFSDLAKQIFEVLEKYTPFYTEFLLGLKRTLAHEKVKRVKRPENYTDAMMTPETALSFLEAIQVQSQKVQSNLTESPGA